MATLEQVRHPWMEALRMIFPCGDSWMVVTGKGCVDQWVDVQPNVGRWSEIDGEENPISEWECRFQVELWMWWSNDGY